LLVPAALLALCLLGALLLPALYKATSAWELQQLQPRRAHILLLLLNVV
jgi:hypothetical protein